MKFRFIAIAATLGLCLSASAQSSLEDNFRNPPSSAKPWTWWHWMNGNASKEGITADLEAMAAAGVGGVQAFNISIMDKGPVDYASKEWYDLMNHAMRECQRLGIEFDMHNSPGWSSTGGFWITPETSGKQVSWSFAYVKGGKKVDIMVPQPAKALGSYWDDILIAYPSTKDEALVEASLAKATIDGKDVPVSSLSLASASEYRFTGSVVLEFSTPVTASSLTGFIRNDMPEPSEAELQQIRQGFGRPNSGPAPQISFSDDGKTWSNPVDISVLPGAMSYASFDAKTFKYAKIDAKATVILRGLQLSGAAIDSGFLRNADYEMSAGGGGGFGMMGRGMQPAGPTAPKNNTGEYAIDPSKVIDISRYMDASGHLVWDAPQGDWTILRVGYVPVDRHTKMGSTVGDGLEVDKLSKEALKFHFDWLYPQLMAELEKSASTVGAGMLIDSYEVGNLNWTPKMREEFRSRRGYDMIGYLPALVGKYVQNEDKTSRFMWDFRRTVADLFADNYAGYFAELLHQHGILLYNEPYNSSVFDEMQVGSRADIPMGEFWVRTHQDRQTLKMASSIAHVNGKRLNGNQIVGAESFTGWQPDAGWQNFPYSLKAQGDDAWTMGLNRYIFHRFSHQPNVNVVPGMSMGTIGFHFDRTNTWFEMGSQWLKYVARSQYLLQQGSIVADALYLVSQDVPGGSHSAWNPDLPFGYWGDQANAEMFLDAVKIDGPDLLSADRTVRYRMLLLQNVNGGRKMTIEVLRKIDSYVSGGGVVCGMAPTTTPNLSSDAELREFASLVQKLWGGIERGGVKQVGRGRVFATLNAKEALDAIGVVPDVEYSFAEDAPVNFIHRDVNGTQIYFLANHRRTAEDLTVTFRVNGLRPELWNSDSGEIVKLDVYEVLPDGRVRVPIHFDPVGSWFVVFRDKAGEGLKSVSRDGVPVISTALYPERKGGLYPDVKDNFTISVWIRPETDSGMPNNAGATSGSTWGGSANSYPYVLGDPEQLYGPGNAIAGIVSTRLGVTIAQRGGMPAQQGRPGMGGPGGMMGGFGMGGGGGAQPVLSAMGKIGSWNHVAAVYRDGVPHLYINGELKGTGQKATASVHPAYKDVAIANNNLFYEGDFAQYKVIDSAWSDADVKAEFSKGAPKDPTAFEPVQATSKGWTVFENGSWTIGGKTVNVKGLGAPKDLTAAGWSVSFQEKRGAPAGISLDRLMPLQQYPDDGVKYFSGTATYRTTFQMKKSELKGKVLYLDLGQVYVIARVKLNGKDLGVVWKNPYRLEITDAVKAGANTLEIEVANLWTNRLIGDAQTPSLYESAGRDGNHLPQWYVNGEPKPENDGKVAYTVADFYNADEPLYDSGLVGPVVIRSAVRF